mmetsp:Transcript_2714/g.9599  ORF Transcript_2714/g.9599 Transcript_2714/m.9599 type:complete len:216 (-) Transcript_2714:1284-1931(-)
MARRTLTPTGRSALIDEVAALKAVRTSSGRKVTRYSSLAVAPFTSAAARASFRSKCAALPSWRTVSISLPIRSMQKTRVRQRGMNASSSSSAASNACVSWPPSDASSSSFSSVSSGCCALPGALAPLRAVDDAEMTFLKRRRYLEMLAGPRYSTSDVISSSRALRSSVSFSRSSMRRSCSSRPSPASATAGGLIWSSWRRQTTAALRRDFSSTSR